MHRIFGRPKAPEAKPAEPAVSLDGHIQKLEGRVPDLDKKIAQCDAELVQIKAQLGKCRTAAQQQPLKQKAMQILKRKQMYSNQRDSMMQRAFNLEQTQFAIDSMKEAKEHVEVMKSSTTAMKDAAGAFDVGEIEDLHDDMFDMMADVGDVNEILSRPLDMYDAVNESDLDAALAGLDDEIGVGDVTAAGVGSSASASADEAFPSYLLPAGGSAAPAPAAAAPVPVLAGAGGGGGPASYPSVPAVPLSAGGSKAPAATGAAARF